jgi:ATP-dependent DNA ligase
MAPTLVREPFQRAGWIYEEKVDGWRMLAYKDGHRVQLVSRTPSTTPGASPTSRGRHEAPRTLVLDGEVAIHDLPRTNFSYDRGPG